LKTAVTYTTRIKCYT